MRAASGRPPGHAGWTRSVHNPPALLGTQIDSLLRTLREDFDSIIIDSPPVNVIADAAAIGARSDGVLVVARAGVTNRRALAYAVDQLRRVGAPVLGAMLNDVDYRRDADYDEAYEYYAEYAGMPEPGTVHQAERAPDRQHATVGRGAPVEPNSRRARHG